MATPESAPRGGKFFTSSSIIVGNYALTCNNLCAPGEDCSTAVGYSSLDNTHTSDSFNKGKRLGGQPSTLVQHAQRTGGSSDG
jgi:hypothetical protein